MKPMSAYMAVDRKDGLSPVRHQVRAAASADVSYLPVDLLPLKGAAIDVNIEGYRSPRVSVWLTSSVTGFQTRPNDGLDAFVVRIPYRGHVLRREKHEEIIVKPGSAILQPFSPQASFITSENVSLLSCAIDRTALIACQQKLVAESEQSRFTNFAPVASLNDMPMLALARTLELIQRSRQAEVDLMFPLLEEMLLLQVAGAWPRSDSGQTLAPAAAFNVAGRATGFIEAHLAAPITISDVAEAAGVGIRTLQKVFKTKLGCSPAHYIIDRRLEKVHTELMHCGDAAYVSQIALRWGFTHMSDFARRYKDRYGVLPSATMRRSVIDRF